MQTETVIHSGDGEQQTCSEIMDLHRIQFEIEQLDHEWEQLSAKLMARDLNGSPQIPMTGSGIVCGLISVCLGVMFALLWWISLSAPTPLLMKTFVNSVYGLSCLVLFFGFVYGMQYHAKALRYNHLYAAHQSKRAWLQARLESLHR